MTERAVNQPRRSRRSRLLFGALALCAVVYSVLLWQAPQFTVLPWIAQHVHSNEAPIMRGEIRIFERDGRRWLWGGGEREDHFDITQFDLDPRNFHYGLGREHFPALIEPEFMPASKVGDWLRPEDRVLAVKDGEAVKVYPLRLMTHHEVVNDIINGEPVFVAYCGLADLGAVYQRRIDGRTHTFALSGYTCADQDVWGGLNAFVLWDRETESLWWPPLGRAVSGPMRGRALELYEHATWAQVTWSEAFDQHPNAVVLQPNQDFERPKSWTRFDTVLSTPTTSINTDESGQSIPIAPKWGENRWGGSPNSEKSE